MKVQAIQDSGVKYDHFHLYLGTLSLKDHFIKRYHVETGSLYTFFLKKQVIWRIS